MGRGIGKVADRFPGATPMPVVPTENVGIMSGPIRKPRGGRRKIDKRGSRRGYGGMIQVTSRDPKTGQMYGGLIKDGIPQFKKPDGTSPEISVNRRPESLGAYNPVSGVRYTRSGIPTAVQQTRRVAVQDPTLGGQPEREVPIARERRQRITRESDPRGGAPFSPDERGMARDRFFERMFDRADERKQQRSMEREERGNVRDALKSERGIRESEMARPGDERYVSTEEKERRQMRRQKQEFDEFKRTGRRRRRGGGMRRRRGRRRDFTRRFSRAEGGRRGRSGREMAEFRDQYVSTLR